MKTLKEVFYLIIYAFIPFYGQAQHDHVKAIERIVNNTYHSDNLKFKINLIIFENDEQNENEVYKYAKTGDNIFLDYGNNEIYLSNKDIAIIVNNEEKSIIVLNEIHKKTITHFDISDLKGNDKFFEFSKIGLDSLCKIYIINKDNKMLAYEIKWQNGKLTSFYYYPNKIQMQIDNKKLKAGFVIIDDKNWEVLTINDVLKAYDKRKLTLTRKYKDYEIEYENQY
jgi:hypothetical protein